MAQTYMPAEWQPHTKTWMGWPDWPCNWRSGAAPAQSAFARVAAAISEFEPVTVCANEAQLDSARAQLPEAINVVCVPHEDAWLRDTGPTFLLTSEAVDEQPALVGVNWKFNQYGREQGAGTYQNLDNQVSDCILKLEGLNGLDIDFVLEGGSFHTDGEGTLLTTAECLMDPGRNPNLSRQDIEHRLKRYLGVDKVLWLPRGLSHDHDTVGHIDNVACFARPGMVLLAWTDNRKDLQWERSKEALCFLSNSKDARGRSLQVIKVPLPPPLHYTEEDVRSLQPIADGTRIRRAGEQMAASYINFYIANGGIVMPAFGGEAAAADARAQKVLQKVFPDRKVVAVQTRDVLLGEG